MSGGQPDLGYVMNQGEFDDPLAAAMSNNNSFNIGQAGHRGYDPNQLMVPGGMRGNDMAPNGSGHQNHANQHHGQMQNGYRNEDGSTGTSRGSSNLTKRQNAAQRNIQATFYSDGTNVTGTTAATRGAVS